MIIHVDVLMIFARTQKHIDDIKRELKTDCSIKGRTELGELKYCLGIELKRDINSKTIRLNQRGYIKRLAEKYGIDKCKDVHTPTNEG
uniref:Reverse transcriptase Ty1/copia-type domain-containing protein n=1 Tax=Peronospora matthiolae TaxID=2874970 RepID=A0AAV1VDU3_9STRA